MKYGVQASSFGAQINVGALNKKGDAFVAGKEDGTDMVLAATASYVAQHFDGGMVVTFPGMNLTMTVQVTPFMTVPDAPTDEMPELSAPGTDYTEQEN